MAASEASIQVSSDAPLEPSSPCSADVPLSTPPSSPPDFPWQSEQPQRADDKAVSVKAQQSITFNALSVLGKRKAVLQSTSHNARPAKRTTLAALPKSRTTTMTQMQLALGQKVEKKCEDCGMVYVLSSGEDRKLHERFHTKTLRGCEMGNEFVRKTPDGNLTRVVRDRISTATDDVICVVTRADQKWRRKYAREVLDITTSSLGACIITDEELWAGYHETRKSEITAADGECKGITPLFELYLYIRAGRCVSAAVVESLKHKARRVVRPSTDTQTTDTALSALEKLRARRQAEKTHDDRSLTLSDATYDITTGISRIWTAPAFRGQGLAMALLDDIYKRRTLARDSSTVPKVDAIAFSQPTTAGARLARKWFGQKHGWCAYG